MDYRTTLTQPAVQEEVRFFKLGDRLSLTRLHYYYLLSFTDGDGEHRFRPVMLGSEATDRYLIIKQEPLRITARPIGNTMYDRYMYISQDSVFVTAQLAYCFCKV
jgi:hypothetical protein